MRNRTADLLITKELSSFWLLIISSGYVFRQITYIVRNLPLS